MTLEVRLSRVSNTFTDPGYQIAFGRRLKAVGFAWHCPITANGIMASLRILPCTFVHSIPTFRGVRDFTNTLVTALL